MMIGEINMIPVIIAAILYLVFASFWYSPAFLGKVWLKATGFSEEEMRGKYIGFAGCFVIAMVIGYVIAHFENLMNVKGLFDGMCVGFWCWFGFVATTSFASVLWEKTSLKVYFVNTAFFFVAFVLMGGMFAWWR